MGNPLIDRGSCIPHCSARRRDGVFEYPGTTAPRTVIMEVNPVLTLGSKPSNAPFFAEGGITGSYISYSEGVCVCECVRVRRWPFLIIVT